MTGVQTCALPICYADLAGTIAAATAEYIADVREGRFPEVKPRAAAVREPE